MRTVLVTGSPEAVEPVVAAVRAAGADGVGITADTDLVATLRKLDPGSVGCYVQLPIGITPSGDTAVSRVHSFLEQGLLTRFRLVDAVLPALADDSGLAVDVLNQMPGVRSARWAGPGASDQENNALLLRQLADVPAAERTARFVCAMALVLPDGIEHVRIGEMRGRIAVSPAGHNGFGYDPLFVADGYAMTNGELEPSAKDAISHRGRAVRAILPVLLTELRRLRPFAQKG